MGCNSCETSFELAQTVRVNVQKSGSKALVYLTNQGRSVVLIRRIALCAAFPKGGSQMLMLRAAPDGITWLHPSTYLEVGFTLLFYVWDDIPEGSIVQAQAEYVEIAGRSQSCPANF